MDYCSIIKDQTERALWEVKNVISCIPDDLWDRCYCEMPMWKHVYHMLHSLDQWFINPKSYEEPPIHEQDLNNLDVMSSKTLSKMDISTYYKSISDKIMNYLNGLQDKDLLQNPRDCEYSRYTLILAQHRHLHTHMGMIMGFIIEDTGKWPMVIGLEGNVPDGFGIYFE